MTIHRAARNPVVVFFGWLLMGIGGLIAVTAGACSLFFLVSMLSGSGGNLAGIPGMLGLMLLFGGIPLAVGAALFFAGRAISRPRITRQD
jgi:hypothetical protein